MVGCMRDAMAVRPPLLAPLGFPVELWFPVILLCPLLPATPGPPCFHPRSEGNKGPEAASKGQRLQRIQ